MAQSEIILRPDQLKWVLAGRFGVYVFGAVVSFAMVPVADLSLLVPTIGAAAALLAYFQMQIGSLYQAWALDMVYATSMLYLSNSPVGFTVVVGWSAGLGLVGTPRRWQLPLGVATAAAVAASAWEFDSERSLFESAVAVLAVVLVSTLFAVVFRAVGQRIQQNERELRDFFDRVPVALVRTNPAGELLEFNHAITEMFEDPRVGENVIARYVDGEQRRVFVEKLVTEGRVRDYEVIFKTGPEKTINGVIASNAIKNDDGSLRYIESAIYDFTALRRIERERETLARVIDSATDLVALGNWDGSIRYANPAARKWMERYVTSDEYAHFGQALSRQDFVAIRTAIQDYGMWSGVVTVPGREESRVVSTSIQVLDADHDYTVASISRDVTNEVETEERLKELVRAKDELVASISHEIRTPLSVVLGLSMELRDNYGDFSTDEHLEFAEAVADQGQEMTNIVEDLLVAARGESGSIVLVHEPVDLRKEVDSTLRLLPRSGQPRSLDNSAEGQCWGDSGRVRQILRNLFLNASRYGGERLFVSTEAEGDMIRLRVVDDGPGVPAGDVEAIFEPFARAHPAGSQPASIGLGLTVSRNLARRMGGDLEYSREGGHTVFTLTLPAVPGSEEASA